MATYKLTQQSGVFSGGPHSDYPAYVDLSEIDASMSQADADSIRVYTDAALSNEIPREIVSTEEMHCKIGSFSSGGEIYVVIDGTSSDYATDATFGAENVWNSNYKGVWHKNDATTSSILDSTSNDNDGTKSGANQPNEVTGKIGQAQDYDTGDHSINVGNSTTLDTPNNLTVSAWINPSQVAANTAVVGKDVAGNRQLYFLQNQDECIVYIFDSNQDFSNDNNATRTAISAAPAPFSAGNWYYVVFTYEYGGGTDNSTGIIYIDGSLNVTNNTLTGPIDGRTNNAYIGQREFSTLEDYYQGDIDEVRILEATLSSDWITTEYNNQNSPSTFWSVEEVVTEVNRNPLFAFGGM